MEIRTARTEELDDIRALVDDPNIELVPSRTFVAVGEHGRILAVLPLRLAWLAEPLVVAGANRAESSRAAVGVYRAAEDFIAKCSMPVLPPRWFFAASRSPAVNSWSKRLGWHRIFQGAAFFIKHLPRR